MTELSVQSCCSFQCKGTCLLSVHVFLSGMIGAFFRLASENIEFLCGHDCNRIHMLRRIGEDLAQVLHKPEHGRGIFRIGFL